jgi:hypothetical protein
LITQGCLVMRIGLQIALMASATCFAISFPLNAEGASPHPAQGPGNEPAIYAILEGNRRVFVNDAGPARSGERPPPTSPPEIDVAIQRVATRHRMDADLLRSVAKVESNFNPRAVSPKGAMGLMQLMPATAHRFGLASPFDVEQNLDAGTRYLKQLLGGYGGDLDLALAAYNAGEGAVARFGGVPNYAETQAYVRRVNAVYRGTAVTDTTVKRQRPTERYSSGPIRVERDGRGALYISNTD